MSSNDAEEEAHVKKLWVEAVAGALQGKESSMEVDEGDVDMSSFTTVLQSLQQSGQDVRSYINGLPRKKALGLSQVLREEVAPVRRATKDYIQALFEADRDLVQALRAANKQLAAMDQATSSPVSVVECLRYAHTIRTTTSAPPDWTPALEEHHILPPRPYMPISERIAASDIMRLHLDQQAKRRRGGAAPEEEEEDEVATLIKQASVVVETLAPPPGWAPGAKVDIDIKELDSLDTAALELAVQRSRSDLGEGTGSQPPPTPSAALLPVPPSEPVVTPKPPVAGGGRKKPLKMLGGDSDDEEDEEDEED